MAKNTKETANNIPLTPCSNSNLSNILQASTKKNQACTQFKENEATDTHQTIYNWKNKFESIGPVLDTP